MIQAYNAFLAPPLTSDRAFAVMALVAYAVFAIAAWRLARRAGVRRSAETNV
jgi:hypothetical protein